MTTQAEYTVLLAGLGQIGFGYDAQCPENEIYSHARAFTRHKGFRLVAGVDPDAKKTARFHAANGVTTYASMQAVPDMTVDVVVVATPTAFHLETVREALRFKPRLLVLEKPVSTDLASAREIQRLLEAAKIPCFVNYIRRADPGLRKLCAGIQAGTYGKLQAGTCVYSGGTLTNASHYIDLLNAAFGPGKLTGPVVNRRWHVAGVDPEAAFTLKYGEATVNFTPVDPAHYSLGELDLLFTGARVRLTRFCELIEISARAPDPAFPGHWALTPSKDSPVTDMKRYQWNVAVHLHDHLSGGCALFSEIHSGLVAQAVCQDIFNAISAPGSIK